MYKCRVTLLTLLISALLFANAIVAAEPVKLTFYCANAGMEMFKAIGQEFEAQNPNIKVDVTWPPGSGSYYNKLKLALATGSGPDLFWLGNGIYQFTDGFLLPLQDYVANDPNISTIPKAVMSVNQWAGNQYGIPYGLNITAVYYNKQLFNQAGLRAMSTWSWDDVIAVSGKLVRDKDGDGVNDVWAFSMKDGAPWFLYSYGGSPYDADGKRMTINNPMNVAGLQKIAEIFERRYTPPFDKRDWEARTAFSNSTLAMTVDGPYAMPILDAVKDLDYDIIHLPGLSYNGKTTQVDVMQPESFAVSAITKYPKEAVAFLKFLTSRNNVTTYAKMGSIVPTLPAAMSSYVSADTTHNRKVFIDAMQYFRTPYIYQHPAFYDFDGQVQSDRNMVFLGNMAAGTSILNSEEYSNKIIAEYWSRK